MSFNKEPSKPIVGPFNPYVVGLDLGITESNVYNKTNNGSYLRPRKVEIIHVRGRETFMKALEQAALDPLAHGLFHYTITTIPLLLE